MNRIPWDILFKILDQFKLIRVVFQGLLLCYDDLKEDYLLFILDKLFKDFRICYDLKVIDNKNKYIQVYLKFDDYD